MKTLQNLEVNRPVILDNTYQYQGQEQRIYINKSMFQKKEQYFLQLALPQKDIAMVQQGYIYFYMDHKQKTSDFIGLYLKPECRGMGLSSLLISNWIKLCLDNGYEHLDTNKKQRKPFLLYSLKKYQFELEDKTKYETSPCTIHICHKENDKTKYLLFKTKGFSETFKNSKIMKVDNYEILEEYNPEIPIVDDVLLSHPYFLQDNEKAYQKAKSVITRFH